MLVKYIDNNRTIGLTYGNVYEVWDRTDYQYKICNNFGEIKWYSSNRFKEVE